MDIGDSVDESLSGNDGRESAPANLAPAGEWTALITGYGHSSWFEWRARANREFTVEAVVLDENGQPTTNKAQPVLGMWNGTDAVNVARSPHPAALQRSGSRPHGTLGNHHHRQ